MVKPPHKIENPKYSVRSEKLWVDVIKDSRVTGNGTPIEYVAPKVVDGEVKSRLMRKILQKR